MDLLTTSIRIGMIAFIWAFLLIIGRKPQVRRGVGWSWFVAGFGLALFGSIIDFLGALHAFADSALAKGTRLNLILEELIGYCLGIVCLFIGFVRLVPAIWKYWHTEKMLEAERDFSQNLLREAPVIVCGLDSDGTITFMNSEGERISGYGESELVGRNWRDVCKAEEGAAGHDELFSVRADRHARGYEMTMTRKDGTKLVISWNPLRRFNRETGREEYIGFGIDMTERKRFEEALKKSEHRCRTLFVQASDGITIMSDDGIIRSANPAMCASLGYAEDELIGKHVLDLIPRDDLEKLPDQWDNILSGRPQLFDRVMQAKDGTRRILEVSAKRLDEDLVQCLYRDVTRRKKAEEALKESERLYRSLFRESAISLWLEDLSGVRTRIGNLKQEGVEDLEAYFDANPDQVKQFLKDVRIVDVNHKTLELLAADSLEQLRGSMEVIIPYDEYPTISRGIIALSKEKAFFRSEIDHIALDGRRKHFIAQYNVVPGYEQTLARVIVSLDDITERKRAEDALKKSEERYRNIFENAPVGIFRTTLEGTYLSINPEGAKMYGYDSPQDMMESINDIGGQLYLDREKRLEFIRLSREKAELRQYEFEAKRKDGSSIIVSVHSRPVLDENGEIIGFDGFNTDVTLRKHAEEQLRKLSGKVLAAQEDERKRIGRELHDGPGQTLSALKILLKRQMDVIAEQAPEADLSGMKKTLDYIEDSIVEIRRILMDLRPAMLDDLGLVAAVEWLCREFETRFKSIGVKTQIDISEQSIDESKKIVLFRVLQEALSNISKHSRAKNAEVSMIQENGQIRLMVKDDGIGMDMSRDMDGIGLQGMRERIEAVSGSFMVQSGRNEGTEIKLEVPL